MSDKLYFEPLTLEDVLSIHEKEKPVEERLSRRSMEVEAESVAFVVGTALSAEHPELKLDFSDYSFGYIAGWSSGKDAKELKTSLERIRSTADDIITAVDKSIEKQNFLERASKSRDEAR